MKAQKVVRMVIINTFFDNLFYHKLNAKYVHVKQLSQKMQYFLRKLQKTVLGTHMTIFSGKWGILCKKINITLFITNWVSHILLLSFSKRAVFSEKTICRRTWPFRGERGISQQKLIYHFFW